jgi:FemAB-related protein (PEP-CTERM system-associated)
MVPSQVTIRRDVPETEWNAFVEACPSATPYHAWRWRLIFERAFGHRAEYLAAVENDRVVGVLPLVVFNSWLFGRFAVSLPFVNYGGVLAHDEGVARQLLDAAVSLAREESLSHVEMRHRTARFQDLPSKRHKVAMRLELASSEQQAWDGLDRKVRNQVRKAEKSGLTAHAGGAELLDQFYDVFAHNMRDLGTPVHSRRFFREILEQFPEASRAFTIRDGDQPVAAAFTIGYRETLEVPWGGSLRSYRNSSANMLLYWTMIHHAGTAGYRVFDFGRSTPGEGTFNFKRQWGALPQPLVWEYGLLNGGALPNISPTNSRFSRAIRAWQHLPLWLSRAVGPSIVRHIPA